jgi:putative ABC transport system permease protein
MWTRLVALFTRLGFAGTRRRRDNEAREELGAHLDLLVDRYIRSGMAAEEAHFSARRQMGNLTLVREEIHVMNGIRWLDGLAHDLRYALRQVRHSLGFSAVVVATLALGIGGTTAVFSVMHAVLLAPLPYEQPGQLVRIYQQESDNPATRATGMSAMRFAILRERAASLTDVAGTRSDSRLTGLDLFKDGQAQRLRVLRVTSDYFQALGSASLRGPGFSPDDESGATRGVVLSDALWRTRFNSDLSVVGATIQLSGETREIVGVASRGLEDPVAGAIDVWLPHNLRGERDTALSTVVGRMRAAVSLAQVDAELASLSHATAERSPDDGGRTRMVAVPLHDDVVAPARDFVHLLLMAVGLVLLVACINVANLVLVRTTGRLQEFAVRTALGSSRARLARQLLVESLVLAGLGGVAGIALAALGVRVLQTLGRDALPRLDGVGFNPLVLLFAVVVTIATALTCGVLPALRLAKSDPNRALMGQSRSATGTRRLGRLRSGLAAAQLALALALLAGASVLSVSFYHLTRVDLGFRVDGVLTFEVNLPGLRYPDAQRRAMFQEELAQRLAAIPGVIASGGTSRLPATGSLHPWPMTIESGPLAGTRLKETGRQHRTVSGAFFKALAIPVLAGRTFDHRDDAGMPLRSVVSASIAREAFPGMPFEHVIGQRIRVFVGGIREIIGVVGDVTLDVYGKPTTTVYSAHRQLAGNRNWELTQVVATDGPPESTLPAVRAVVAAMDPELVVYRAAALAEVVGRGASRERFALVLIGAFAGVSLMLAAIGLYGILAYTVRQRTQEIGIRMALGATGAEVRMLVLRQAGHMIGIGLVAGLAGALVLGRWLSSLVFQTSPSDPRILLGTAVLLTMTALVAAWLPALRAGRLEPRVAMQDS